MNIELRGKVLTKALILEDTINKLVLLYLSINKEGRRAIGHKSGTLTYKNLLDLLYDIDVLNREEYNTLLLLMELRNQFMHNLACDSFEKAIEILGNDRGKKLLKFNKLERGTLEEQYLNSFYGLNTECLGIIKLKLQEKKREVTEKHEFIQKLLGFISEYTGMVDAKLNNLIDKYDVHDLKVTNEAELEIKKLQVIFQTHLVEMMGALADKYSTFMTDLLPYNEGMASRILR